MSFEEPTSEEEAENFQARSVRVGIDYEKRAADWLTAQGWKIRGRKVRHASGIELDILANDLTCRSVGVECKGGEVEGRQGLQRSDNIWKVLGQTLALYNWNRAHPTEALRFLCITTAQPLDGERLAEPLRVAEANGQITIVVVP